MALIRTVFNEVSVHSEKVVKCSSCGKRLVRRKKFYQTINPWNKTASGEVKSRYEIMPEITAKAKEWQNEPETCNKCLDAMV